MLVNKTKDVDTAPHWYFYCILLCCFVTGSTTLHSKAHSNRILKVGRAVESTAIVTLSMSCKTLFAYHISAKKHSGQLFLEMHPNSDKTGHAIQKKIIIK